jgi:3-oxoacyl-[acyl-carrier protein] reductase
MPKTAIITGASRGIGKAVAERLARDGFAVVINYANNATEADATVAEIKADGGQAIAVKADVGNAAEVEQMFDQTVKAFGTVDVVVNNSGIMPLSAIGKGDVALFDRVIQTNLRGTFLVMAQAAQRLAGGGRIIAFSSSVLARSFPTYGPYMPRRLESKAWFMCSLTKSEAETSPSMPWRPDPSARSCS